MIESILKSVTESRAQNPTVKHLFDAYCRYGVLTASSKIIEGVQEQLRDPIIHTLGSHITKEKPVFVFSMFESRDSDPASAAGLGGLVDILWTLSLMYDDMLDKDQKRSGLPSAWVKYGGDLAYKSAHAGLEAVQKFASANFGDESGPAIEEYVNKGLASLKSHKELGIGTSVGEIVDNYRQRALFHTALPFMLLHNKDYSDDPAFLAVENVNLAGQILNDLKDVSPKYVWLREGFSDIRSKLITLPSVILLSKLSVHDKDKFLNLFGHPLSDNDKASMIDMFKSSESLAEAVSFARRLYALSLDQFKQVLKPEYMAHVDEWVNYKLKQLAELS